MAACVTCRMFLSDGSGRPFYCPSCAKLMFAQSAAGKRLSCGRDRHGLFLNLLNVRVAPVEQIKES